MKPRVYIETTIPSYLAAWPSRDIIRAAQQQLTRQWWEERRSDFEVVVSQVVFDECAAGDASAAADRIAVIAGLPFVTTTEESLDLAERLIAALSLPERAQRDALHIALAAVHRLEYLLTWNCTHIANAAFRRRIEAECRLRGLEAPIMASPDQLMKGSPNVGG